MWCDLTRKKSPPSGGCEPKPHSIRTAAAHPRPNGERRKIREITNRGEMLYFYKNTKNETQTIQKISSR